MGKGDKKSFRGKLWSGTNGNVRPKKTRNHVTSKKATPIK